MNLLEETLEDLKLNKKTVSEVDWVGTREYFFTWAEFEKIAKTAEYDSGFGAQEVARNLLIIGKDFYMDRHEYDGSESWSFHSIIEKPAKTFKLKALTVGQAKASVSCGWNDLEDLNGIKK